MHPAAASCPAARRSGSLLRLLLSSAARTMLWLGPVYLAGYLGLSGSWVLLGLALWLCWGHNRRWKRDRLAAAFALLEDEREAVCRGLAARHLPAWVHFPDVERVEWLNKVLVQAWPYFGTIMEKTFKEIVEPKIRAKNVHLKTCTFTKIHFGEKCPRINGIKAYTKEIDRRQVTLDLQICYVGDCEIHMDISKFNLGVKGVQLYGTLRVILEPLLNDAPFIGAVTLFFMQKPHLEINWAGMSNLLDVPGINVMSDSLIQDFIASRLVLPNRITVPLKKDMNIAHLRFPIPHGVVRVHLLEAENLVQKDSFLGAIRGKSDPYALLRVGTVQYRSKTVSRDLNPVWNETFEFVVHELPGQDLEVDLYDEDPDKDDFMGSLLISLVDVMNDRTVDEWFPLSKTTSGHLHLKLEWLSLVNDQEKLHEDKKGLSTAILIVYLDGAFNLPVTDICATIFLLQTCNFSKDPTWGQAFTFFVHSAHSQSLHIKDKDRDSALGTSVVCLSHLLKDPNMTLDQRFQLDHSSSDSFIKMKLVLRVSCSLSCSLGFPNRKALIVQLSYSGTEVPLGEIQLTVRYASIRQSLVVLVNGCRNLVPSSNRGVDPYVRIYLLPDRRWTSRKKTSVKKKTLNPQYDEKFEFFESLEDVKRRTLDVAVKNSRPFISQDRKELGKVRIDLSQEDLIKGFAQW
uniref:Extended synaptotagmin 3 n=1 Tax=Strigops habroptila TaxID=2489341 RepID=A0A672TJH6_STRHB